MRLIFKQIDLVGSILKPEVARFWLLSVKRGQSIEAGRNKVRERGSHSASSR
jgi:hypothetical protein